MTQQSKVREILYNLNKSMLNGVKAKDAQQAAEQALYDAMLGVIGGREKRKEYVCSCRLDEKTGYRVTVEPVVTRNNLRNDQEEALNALFGKKGKTE